MLEIDQRYYTPEEAADLLRVTRRSVYSYIKGGKLQATKDAAGKWRISTRSLLLFLGEPEAPISAFNDEMLQVGKDYVSARDSA